METEKTIRLFIGIDLPAQVLQEVERLQRLLKEARLFEGRYTKPEQVHITLHFIGEVNADQIVAIDEALQNISLQKYQAQLSGVDVFAVSNIIKIIYLNVVVPGIAELAQQLNYILQPWRVPEERPFVSHATIAHVKKVEDQHALLNFLQTLQVEPIAFTIDNFVLKESILLPDGAEYKMIKKYELG